MRILITFLFLFSFLLFSCTKGKSFNEIKQYYSISSNGKSNIEIIIALDVWGATSFADWQTVKQTTNEEKGIFIFRYRDSYRMGMGTNCGILVSVQVKRIDDANFSVTFSNITHHLSDCTWINASGVAELSAKFRRIAKTVEKVIADF